MNSPHIYARHRASFLSVCLNLILAILGALGKRDCSLHKRMHHLQSNFPHKVAWLQLPTEKSGYKQNNKIRKAGTQLLYTMHFTI